MKAYKGFDKNMQCRGFQFEVGKEYETIADIVANMRYGIIPKHRTDHELLALYADRIEAVARATAEKSSVVGDAAKLREALSDACYAMFNFLKAQNGGYEEIANAFDKAKAALAAPARNCDMGTLDRHTGKWLNGDNYEYEFAYCSECGHMQWAGWDSHSHACERISDFHMGYKFCPNCGASMVEGVYINGKGKNHGSK